MLELPSKLPPKQKAVYFLKLRKSSEVTEETIEKEVVSGEINDNMMRNLESLLQGIFVPFCVRRQV